MQVGRSFLVRSCLLVTLIKCPKGHKCVGSLCRLVKTLIVSSVRPRDQGTRCSVAGQLIINTKAISCQCKKDVSHFVLTLFPCQNCRWFMLFHPWYIPQYFPGVDLWQPKLSAIERRKFSFLGKAGNKEAKKTVKIKPTISALTPVHFSYVQRVPLFKNLISCFFWKTTPPQ